MVDFTATQQWPDGFIRDAAQALTAIEEIHGAAPALVEAPLDPGAQARMLSALGAPRISAANAAASRIAHLRPLTDGR